MSRATPRNAADTAQTPTGGRAERSRRSATAAFSLIEVLAAVGIFAVGMFAVLGLLTPVAKSVGDVADADASAKVSESLRAFLKARGVDALTPLLKNSNAKGHELTDADAKTDYDITKDAQLIFASRDGVKIGLYGDPVWIDPSSKRPVDTDKFFEIALIRNEAISPNATADKTAAVVGYTARIRWPAFTPDATPGNTRLALPTGANPTGTVRFDHSSKQATYCSGAVTR